jgi:hypothetical protein
MAHRHIDCRDDVLRAIGEAHDGRSAALMAGITRVERELQRLGTRPISPEHGAPEHGAEVGEERVVLRVLDA